MNGGDFWVFEDGCNGGVRNKLLPCLKDLAKAGMDLELMMYGKVIPGFDSGVKAAEFCDNFNAEMKKISDFCDKIINGNLSVEEQLNIIAQVSERGANLLKQSGSKEGNPIYGEVLTGIKVFKVLSDSWDEITSPSTSDSDRSRKIIETAKEVVDTLPESVRASALGKLVDHVNTINEIDKKFDGVDILINNAAIDLPDLFMRKKTEDFRRVMEVNVIGAYNCARRAYSHMMKKEAGKIINITSTNGINTYYPMCLDYDASKAALISLTHNLAIQFAPYVNVNAIAPGFIGTEKELEGYDEEFLKQETEKILLKRYGKPEEVAELVKFLISEKASYISNTVIRIDGGQMGSN